MMNITKREWWIIVAAVILVVIAVIVGYAIRGGTENSSGNTGALTTPPSATETVTPVPANIVVPNMGATTTPPNVAVPVVQGAGDPSGSVSYRSFNISIDAGTYSPDTVIVRQGDTVNLKITAVDGNYGFTQPNYGFNAVILKGKTQTIQFEALQAGDFLFYCASCGGPSNGPVGHIIVTGK